MVIKKGDLNISSELNSKYTNLKNKLISLSEIGITSRVFSYWKNNELIIYNTESDKRSKVLLNYFDAFWLMIIKELRLFGISDKIIKNIRTTLYSTIIDSYKNGLVSKDDLLKYVYGFDADGEEEDFKNYYNNILEDIEKIPEDDLVYLSLIGSIITSILIMNDEPNLIILALKDDETNPTESLTIHISSKSEVLDSDMNKKIYGTDVSRLTIPLKPIYDKLFLTDIKTTSLLQYRLISDKENQILELIKKGDFKELIIKMPENELTVTVRNNGEIKGDKVKEIRRLLGVKDYKNITLKFRNDKHIYFENERNDI